MNLAELLAELEEKEIWIFPFSPHGKTKWDRKKNIVTGEILLPNDIFLGKKGLLSEERDKWVIMLLGIPRNRYNEILKEDEKNGLKDKVIPQEKPRQSREERESIVSILR